jgi:DNA polymerase II large subunit
MRAKEFAIEEILIPSLSNLISILDNLRSKTDQIRIDSLVNLVRKRPGSEMFNIDLLVDAYKNNEIVKNLVRDIKDDDSGVKYVHLKGLTNDNDELLPDTKGISGNYPVGSRNPQTTVKAMAKRANSKRL